MPSTTYEVRVSFREQDRPRFMRAQAVDRNGVVIGISVHINVDANGTLDGDTKVVERYFLTGSDGAVYFRWWRWSEDAGLRDVTSVITATWESDDVDIWLDDLYE